MTTNCYYAMAKAEGEWQDSMIKGQQSTAQMSSLLSEILANDYDTETVVLNQILDGYYKTTKYEGLNDPGMDGDTDDINTTQTTDNYATQEYSGIETTANNFVQAATGMVTQFASLQQQAVSATGSILGDLSYLSNLISGSLV